jgi:hypothetical protein
MNKWQMLPCMPTLTGTGRTDKNECYKVSQNHGIIVGFTEERFPSLISLVSEI